jgi:RNA polymerase sigma factor (sigma-70 family)
MAPDPAIPPQSFDEILAWLHSDRNEAAKIYLQLRDGLTRIFNWNRCADPDGLTDEVFDRAARKVHDLRPTYDGDPKLFFYGIARNLVKESPKRFKKQVSLEGTDLPAPNPQPEDEIAVIREECLHSCLQKLSAEKRELILGYYLKEKQAKIDYRNELAQKMGISIETLRVRVHRIRGTLEKCIEQCLDGMDQQK